MVEHKAYMVAEYKVRANFNISWHIEDFIYAYMLANEINDDEFMLKEEDFFKRFNELDLKGLRQTIIQDINERLCIAFSD